MLHYRIQNLAILIVLGVAASAHAAFTPALGQAGTRSVGDNPGCDRAIASPSSHTPARPRWPDQSFQPHAIGIDSAQSDSMSAPTAQLQLTDAPAGAFLVLVGLVCLFVARQHHRLSHLCDVLADHGHRGLDLVPRLLASAANQPDRASRRARLAVNDSGHLEDGPGSDIAETIGFVGLLRRLAGSALPARINSQTVTATGDVQIHSCLPQGGLTSPLLFYESGPTPSASRGPPLPNSIPRSAWILVQRVA